MKHYILSTSIIFIALSQFSLAEIENTTMKWIRLSATTQNLHEGMADLEGGSPDHSTHTKDLEQVEDALNKLVESGDLVSKKVELKISDEKDQKSLKQLSDSIDDLRVKYGIHTANEMCDIGARHHFYIIPPGENLKLNIRLPKNELNIFLAKIKELDLYAK